MSSLQSTHRFLNSSATTRVLRASTVVDFGPVINAGIVIVSIISIVIIRASG